MRKGVKGDFMKKIIIGRTVDDVRKILSRFNVISIRVGFNNKFKRYLGLTFIPEYLKILEIKNAFIDIKEDKEQIFLTV